jgi:hypothetical protein
MKKSQAIGLSESSRVKMSGREEEAGATTTVEGRE